MPLLSAAFRLRPEIHKRDKKSCNFNLIKKGLAISGFLLICRSRYHSGMPFQEWRARAASCAIIDPVLASACLAVESAEKPSCYLWDCIHDSTR